jgi:uncharacterized protein
MQERAKFKVVIDTNIFVSSFMGGNPRKIIDFWKKSEIILCLSNDILDEYIDVLKRMGFINEEELTELLLLFSKGFNILFTTKTPRIEFVKDDPDDDKFIECSVALSADFIITGDNDLLSLKRYMSIKILSPLEFVKYHENFATNNKRKD